MRKYLNTIVNKKPKIKKVHKNQNKQMTELKIILETNEDLIINKKILENLFFLNNPYVKHNLLYKKILNIFSKDFNEKFINYLINIHMKKEKKKLIDYNDYLVIVNKLNYY